MATVLPGGAKPGRWAELVLLVFALGLSFFAYAQVGVAVTGRLPGQMAVQCGGFTLLVLVVHLILRWRAPYADPVIFPVTVLLNGTGLAMIYRLGLRYEEIGADPGPVIAYKQLIWTVLGLVAAAVTVIWLRDHRSLRRFTYTAMILGLVGLILPLAPWIGRNINGSQIWIHLGPLSFQPAELSKIALAVFFAGYLVTRRDAMALAGPKILGLRLPRLRDMGPIMLAWLMSMGVLVFERDLGTSLLLFGLFVVMIYVATNRPSWIVIGLGLFSGGVVLAYKMFSHVQNRFDIWLHPFSQELYAKPLGGSGQLVQGLFGMANGGLFGTGLGEGRPDITPLAYSDFIFAALGEELGLTGLVALLLIYLVLVERGFRTAIGIRDGFGKLLATGLAFTLAFQLFVVVGGVTRVIPLTGLVTPFLAYGGSALLANWIVVALLLRISDGARRPPPATSEIDLGPVLQAEAAKRALHDAAGSGSSSKAAKPRSGSGLPTPQDGQATEAVRRP
ncbi:MAG: FtsW/RodA/SpoVE family cell cycle protein [Bifidobacteriaceae bacterium]|jgi:cell division protein FtsW (lipid II flippase)|nr:FtsW/RodA/SpoVE family cell cycle protein [Bifidobacteriaceae bacterium]